MIQFTQEPKTKQQKQKQNKKTTAKMIRKLVRNSTLDAGFCVSGYSKGKIILNTLELANWRVSRALFTNKIYPNQHYTKSFLKLTSRY